MATYITADSLYIRDIEPDSKIFIQKELEKFCGLAYNITALPSGDFLITIDEDHLEAHGRNDIGSLLIKRDIYGPCLIVNEKEMI